MYCLYCEKNVKPKTEADFCVCPRCGKPLVAKLGAEEKTHLVQGLHRKENELRDSFDQGMSALVLGAILLVIGAVFFSLAFKLDLSNQADNTRYLRFDSFEFWVAAFCFAVGGGAVIFALFAISRSARGLRVLRHDIAAINDTMETEVGRTGLWLPEYVSNLRIKIANETKLLRVEREAKKRKKTLAGKAKRD